MSNILSATNICKTYGKGDNAVNILNDASLEIKQGEIVGLVGVSGSGKSTFLQIAGLVDVPDSGEIILNGYNYSKATDTQRTNARLRDIGFIYQFHYLLNEFTAIENIMIPLLIASENKKNAYEKARNIMELLGILNKANNLPTQLSGGERQRVAIARSLVSSPKMLFADEPTGNLDPKNSDIVFDLMIEMSRKMGLSGLIVTHNFDLAKKLDRIVTIKDGQIV